MNSQAPRLWCGQFKHQHIGHKGPLVHENTFGEDYSNPALHRVGLLCRSQSRMALLRGAENTSCKTSRKTKMPSSTLIWLQRCKHRSPPRPPPGKGSRRKGEFKTAPPRSACCPFPLACAICWLLDGILVPCSLLCQGVPFLCSIFVSVTPVLVLARRLTLCRRGDASCMSASRSSVPLAHPTDEPPTWMFMGFSKYLDGLHELHKSAKNSYKYKCFKLYF